MPGSRVPGRKVVFTDFLHASAGVKVLLLAAIVMLLITVGIVVVWPVVMGATGGKSQESAARTECRKAVSARLSSGGAPQFGKQRAEEFGQDNWSVRGTVRVDDGSGGTRRRPYECTYAGGDVIHLQLHP